MNKRVKWFLRDDYLAGVHNCWFLNSRFMNSGLLTERLRRSYDTRNIRKLPDGFVAVQESSAVASDFGRVWRDGWRVVFGERFDEFADSRPTCFRTALQFKFYSVRFAFDETDFDLRICRRFYFQDGFCGCRDELIGCRIYHLKILSDGFVIIRRSSQTSDKCPNSFDDSAFNRSCKDGSSRRSHCRKGRSRIVRAAEDNCLFIRNIFALINADCLRTLHQLMQHNVIIFDAFNFFARKTVLVSAIVHLG